MKRIVFGFMLFTLVLPWCPNPTSAQELLAFWNQRRGRSGGTWAPIPRPRRSWEHERSGLYLGGGGLVHVIMEGDSALSKYLEMGKGIDAFLGIRFSENFALEVGTIFSVHSTDTQLEDRYDTALLHALTVDGKFFVFPKSLRLEPFLQFGGGGYTVAENGYAVNAMSGAGFHAGGGLDLRITPALTLGARAIYRGLWMKAGEEILDNSRPGAYLNYLTLEAHFQAHF